MKKRDSFKFGSPPTFCVVGLEKVSRYHPYKRPDAHEVSIRRQFFVKYHQNVRLIFEPRLTTSMLNMQTMEYMTLSDDLFMKVIDFVSCAKLHIDRHSGLRILARFTYLEFQRKKRRFHPYKRPENLKYIKSQLVWTECITASLVELGEMKQEYNQEYMSSSVTEMKEITAKNSQNSPVVSEILLTKVEDITTHDKTMAGEIVELALSSDDISTSVEISKESPVVPVILPAKNKDITTHDENMKDENDAQFPSHDIKPADDIQSNEDNCSSQTDYRNPLLLTENDSIQIQEQANASSIDLSSSTLGNNHIDTTTVIVPMSETLSSELTVHMDNVSSQKDEVENYKSTRAPINEENESADTPKQTDSSTHLSTNEDSDSEIDSETEEALLRIGSDESDCDLGIKASDVERTTRSSNELDEPHDETATDDSIELEEFFKQIDEFLEEVGFKQSDVISEDKTIITEESLTLNDAVTNSSSDQVEEVHPTTDKTIYVERDVKTSKSVDMASQSLLTNNGLKHSNTRCDTEMTLSKHSDNTRNDVEPKTSIIPCGTDSFQSDEREKTDIHMSSSMDDHQQALTEALSSGLTSVEPGPTPCVTHREKSENKEMPENACLHENHQQRQQETKLKSSLELSTEDHTTPFISEDFNPEVIKKEMPKHMTPKFTDQAVSMEMKKDLTELFKPIQIKPELSKQAKPIEIKPAMSEQAKSKEIKQAMLKDVKPKLPIQTKPKNVKPVLPKLLKLNDINLELAQLIKLNDKKPKIVKQARPNGLKPELAKQTKQTDVKVELSKQAKPKVIKQELFNQAQARDIKQGLSKQAEPVEIKQELPKQAKPREIKEERSKWTKIVEIKQELSDQAKSNDIKLEATKEAKLSDAKQELLKHTNAMDIKSELTKQSKLNGVKAELPRQTRPNGVNLEVTKQTKPNDVVKFEEKKKPKFLPIPIKYDNNDKPSGVEGKVKQEIVTTEEKDKSIVYRKVLPPKQKYKPEPRSIVEHNKFKVKAVTTKPKYRPNPVISAQALRASAEQCFEAQNKKFKPVPIVFGEEKKTCSEATMPDSERFKPEPIKTPEKKETEVRASKPKNKPVTFTFGEGKKPKKDKDIEASTPKYKDIQLKLGQESKTSLLTETKVQKRKFMPTPIIFGDDGLRKLDKFSLEQQVEAVAPKRKFKPTPITFGDDEHRKELCSKALPPKPKFKPTPITFGKDVPNKLDKFSQDGCATGVVQTPKPKFKPTPILFENKGLRKIAKSSQEERVEYRKRRFASCLDDTGPQKLKLRY